MAFEMFDRYAAARREVEAPTPIVRVDQRRRLLFNRLAWGLVTRAGAVGTVFSEVTLLFDPDERVAGVAPVWPGQRPPAGARWPVRVMRSTEWPRCVVAEEFVDEYRIGHGSYPVRWLPKMVTFAVGEPQWMPSAHIPGAYLVEEPDALADEVAG